ncbi:hypothetical protein HNP84_006978 [Thermocatellispora tengchongensis]|uniref:Uncharacterized protein n=1 Tax=Thermocatellispora tengchongensis TaxID=1073253 RepID=A0A840PEN8_9ACTN|nr:hypothetical protein [Thermocatellispora tengchongensis]MBB5137226.1 hypothetical protein [Thermocatellispora tengchongensis]
MDDEWELVLATRLLTWMAPGGTRVRNHLLVTRAHLHVDADTERVDVVLGETSPMLQDREILANLPLFTPQRTDRLRQRAREGEGVALQGSAAELLQTWCDRGLDTPITYLPKWTPADKAGKLAEVRLAPNRVEEYRGTSHSSRSSGRSRPHGAKRLAADRTRTKGNQHS